MKYVFFIDTKQRLGGRQKYFLDFAAYLAELKEHEVYFINNHQEEDIKPYIGGCLNFLNLDEVDFNQFEGATFITPINYAFYLLSKISFLRTCKILFYVYDSDCMRRFFAQNAKKVSIENCLSLIKATKCCLFSDGRVFYDTCLKYGFFNKLMLPLATKNISDFPKNLISAEEINLAYINGFNSLDIKAIINLCNSLIKIDINKKINLHLIGSGNWFTKIDQSQYSPKIRFIYAGALDGLYQINYLKNNVDCVVAYENCSLICASASIPVVIPIISSKNQSDNRYVWIYDANEYVYKWDRDNLLFLRNESFSINYIMHEIYINNNKLSVAQKCYEYFLKKANINFVAEQFVEISKKSSLTLKKLLTNDYIKSQLDEFKAFKEENGNDSYEEFLFPKTEKVEEAKENFFIKLKEKITNILPNKIIYNKLFRIQSAYKRKIKNIRKVYENNGKIKVAFIIVFNSVFPVRPVFEYMVKDSIFDPYIIVVPNISRTYKYMLDTYTEAYEKLKEQYGNRVLHGYDVGKDEYYDLKEEYSILFFCNPYEHLVNPLHHIKYFLDKNCLSIYSSYGFAALKFFDEVISTDFYNCVWKACVETPMNLKYLKENEKIQGKNGIVTGYIKMDKYAEVSATPHIRKRILICPHHTVWGWKTLNISNFLRYSELFINLPSMFPEVDFIFRPHPLLFANLKAHNIWKDSEIEEYMRRLLSNKNMVYDKEGDYMQQFADSDAMIHDCGSFIGEYLYTEKPCCYMMKSFNDTMNSLLPLGQECMQHYYHAFNSDDIINFIKNVVLDGNDVKRSDRINFVEKELKVNYPNAAKFVCDIIKKEINIKSL